MSFPDTG